MLFIYITRLASNEIFSLSNKIHWEVGWAKDLSALLYHAPHICMNEVEISFHVFKAGGTQMMNFRVTEFFSCGCFILHGVKIQGTII